MDRRHDVESKLADTIEYASTRACRRCAAEAHEGVADASRREGRSKAVIAEHRDAQHVAAAQLHVAVKQSNDLESGSETKDLDHDFRVTTGAESDDRNHAGRSWNRFVSSVRSRGTDARRSAIRSAAWPSP